MNLIFTPAAEAQLDHQMAYSRARYGGATAARTFARVRSFLANLSAQPRIGTCLDNGLYESPIPRTPFVILYRLEPPLPAPTAIVRILGFFHGAQDRADFAPDND
jgi:plasmid stabilization system protein ParE